MKKYNSKALLPFKISMQELLLHHIWHHCYFSRPCLQLTDGRSLTVQHPGTWNQHQGPDFLSARLLLGSLAIEGDVEIDLNSSDWFYHKHHEQPVYKQVVLHVVWEDDLKEPAAKPIPTLELRHFVKPSLLNTYRQLILNPIRKKPACHGHWQHIETIYKLDLIEKAILERLQQKAQRILSWLADTQWWEEVAYYTLSYAWGLSNNADAFVRLCCCTPLKTVRREQSSLQRLEALFFGQSGLLIEKPTDTYTKALEKDYAFLRHKYNLEPMQAHSWQFLRMRPHNFPTIRIAQWAAFLFWQTHLHNWMLETTYRQLLHDLNSIVPSPYWQGHYRLGKSASRARQAANPGKQLIHNLCINAIAPYRVAYGLHTQKKQYLEQAIILLQAVPAENNHITRLWQGFHPIQNAYDSQALIGQYKNNCVSRRCTDCVIGLHLLRRGM